MRELTVESDRDPRSADRAAELFRGHEQRIFERTDRMFAALMVLQWLAGIAAALWISPLTWSGTYSQLHIHVWAAVVLGGAISAFPILLVLVLPGRSVTRHVIAVGQMLMSALLIHLTGGRIETHFHVFGSLAFLAVYRDWRVLLTGSAIVAADHYLRGVYWPQSVYGVLAAEPWRWLEHSGWVIFEDVFLTVSIVQSRREMAEIAERQATLETVNEFVERQVLERTAELRVSEASLRLALDKAKESERLKGDFLASMSHEIRTPLNGVVGMTGLLIDTELSAEQREYAHTARSAADSLLGIINDILDFSKIEAGKLAIEPIPFDLEIAAEEVVDLFASQFTRRNLNLILRFAPDAQRRVIGDPGRIRQVLTNLIGNAIKFTSSGHVFVNVQQEHHEGSTAWFRFSVEDTGIGIPADKQARMFERFTQADTSTTRRFGGTGLGLSISKQLIELMGGTIGMRSEPGTGSTFWFTLPLELDGEPEPRSVVTELADVRVLIVDDNAINRRIYHELVTRWGMRNGIFACATEAFSALQTARAQGDPFQVALVDLNMPDMDGEMLARAVKSDPDLRSTVLVLLTSSGQNGDAQRMADAGFAAYLTKPVRPSMLLDAVATAWAARDGHRPRPLVTRRSLVEHAAEASARHATLGPVVDARVLLVEDNVVNQKVARLLVEKLGCRADVAANGCEAVQMVRSLPYDIVFMDCQMPEMDGYDATREIRRLEVDGHRVPIVAMTAQATDGDREKCLEVGMDDYISKPVRTETLRAALEKWVCPTLCEGAAPNNRDTQSVGLEPEMMASLQSLREDGGEEFVTDLMARFVAHTHERLVALRAALAAEDRTTAMLVAHDIKGSSATFGAVCLADLCRELEKELGFNSFVSARMFLDRAEAVFGRLADTLSGSLRPDVSPHEATL